MAKKIMFNDRYGLTQAVLDGRKTMTRRIIKLDKLGEYNFENALKYDWGKTSIKNEARYKVGEVVAIAQSYKDCGNFPNDLDYDEDGYPIMPKNSGYFNKMFVRAELLPHHIRITDVRVERLNDITPDDCLKEGISFIDKIKAYYFDRSDRDQGFYYYTAKHAFASLIDKVSGKGTWESNPYVFVYEFELVD